MSDKNIMPDTSANNKRIAKNTCFLYIRMLFLMVISIYTSRVILASLGVEDYGIYNVVGGIVVISSFFRNTMAGATERFLSFCLGQGDSKVLQDTFKTAMFLHLIICLITLLLAETLGLWFLNHKLNIPLDRLLSANVVFQFSIITFIFSTISAPYNAVLISREKMGVFAYFALFEATMKLMIAYAISTDIMDRLILFAFLLMINSFLLRLLYAWYCRRHFAEVKFSMKYHPGILKKMTGYMGWSLYANLAGVFYGEGINMLLNIFFGPAVNAARGLAYQIQHAIINFTTNFQMAVNPQIVKYYAAEQMSEMYTLMKRSSRFSFYVLLLICMPVLFCTDILFSIWLIEVPEYAIVFCRLVLVISLIDTVSNPLTTATKATGKLRLNALLGGTNLLLIIPISYIFLKKGLPPTVVFYVNIVIAIIGMLIRLFINKRLIRFPVWDFLIDVFAKGWVIAFIAGIIPFIVNSLMDRNLLTLFVVSIISLISISVIVFFVGITHNEKDFLLNKVSIIIAKYK